MSVSAVSVPVLEAAAAHCAKGSPSPLLLRAVLAVVPVIGSMLKGD